VRPTRLASLSLDLDDLWTYLRAAGRAEWQAYPSMLDLVVPRALDLFERLGLPATVFVVGRDAMGARHRAVFARLGNAAAEIGNHSLDHDLALHARTPVAIADDLAAAHDAIVAATGRIPQGFRGPGYGVSPASVAALVRRGYAYDASLFPSAVEPVVRALYRRRMRPRSVSLPPARWREALRPIRPHRLAAPGVSLAEVPVTTMPLFRLPFHGTYLMEIGQSSPAVARAYFRLALLLCRLTGTGPSFVLHGTDFVDGAEVPDLHFAPGMRWPWRDKVALLETALTELASRFQMVTVGGHAAALAREPDLARATVG